MIKSVHEIVREAEDNYTNGTIKVGKYVDYSMYEIIETIIAYLNSKHLSGSTDSLGREKPFFNIVTAAVNIWYRATDIDRKDIRIKPDKAENVGAAFLATVLLQEWMKKAKFGQFLNQWGRALARYGSAVVKFVEKDGELVPSVVPWSRFIPDPADFDAIPRIERLYYTAEQLKAMPEYDSEKVKDLIATRQSRKNAEGQSIDHNNNFIEVYEVHGKMDSRLLEDEPDEDADPKYVQQMHAVAFELGEDGKYHDFTLYRGRESSDPYMLTHLIPEDGRTLSIGAVEYLFDAQWMQNHAVKNIKDTLDIASKLVFQTADSNYVGRNVLSAIETGDIFIHAENKPLTRVANDKPDITALMNFRQMWANVGTEITSTPEAARGITPPSGTALGTVQIVTGQGLSLYEIMTENKGLDLERMLREKIIPHLKKKLDSKDEVVAVLDANGISEIDAVYIPNEAVRRYNREAVKKVFDYVKTGNPASIPTPYARDIEEQKIREELAGLGNTRIFRPDELGEQTWKSALENLEWEVEVEVTNESVDKPAVLQTLTSILQIIGGIASSGRPVTQDEKLLISTILSETGRLSPLQLSMAGAQAPPGVAPLPVTANNGTTSIPSGPVKLPAGNVS